VDESDTAFVVPPLLKEIVEETNDPDLTIKWEETMAGLRDAYGYFAKAFDRYLSSEKLTDSTTRRKMAREAARSVLPNATETKIFVTGNARAFRHFVDLRANEHADAEIRAVALKLLEVLQREAPNLFGDYTVSEHPVAGPVAETPYRKV